MTEILPFRLRLKKEQRPEVVREHPNLGKSPVNYTLLTFNAPEKEIYGLSDDQYQKLVEQMLHGECRVPNRELNEKETVDIVLDLKNEADVGREPVWEGEVKLPEWLRRQKQTTQTQKLDPLPDSLRALLPSNKEESRD